MTLYYPPSINGLSKELNADLNQGVTASATLNNTTNIQNNPGIMLIDRIDSDGVLKSTSLWEYIAFSGTSGSTVTTLTRGMGGTSDQDHSTGAVVEFVPDVVWAQSVIDALANLVDTSTLAIDTDKVVTPSASQTLSAKTLYQPTLSGMVYGDATLPGVISLLNSAHKKRKGYVYDNGDSGTTFTLDFDNGETQKVTLNNNTVTVEFSNMSEGDYVTLYLEQDGTGSRVPTFDDPAKYPGGTAPTFSTGANDIDVVAIRGFNASIPHVLANALDIS